MADPKLMPPLEDVHGGLLTFKDTTNCLGYLFTNKEGDTFCATYGKVDVTPEQAIAHNNILDEQMLKDFDTKFAIGERAGLYLVLDTDNKLVVKTFLGTVVSREVTVKNFGKKGQRTIWFERNGRRFKGRTSKEYDLFWFRRIS
jgi:hypothetical protein